MKTGRLNLVGAFVAILAIFAGGCTLNTAKKQYVLAEKLWADGKYSAAVAEFEKVYARDLKGGLGRQALYRAATTQAYFLSEYGEAIKKFEAYAEISGADPSAWDARVQVGELLFSKMELYDQAIQHYRDLIQRRPNHPDVPLFLFRIAKSQFFLWNFQEAIRSYRDLIRRYPQSQWAERAGYEIGVTYFTRGEQRDQDGKVSTESYQEAIDAYEDFIKKNPKSEWVPQARFGIASCLEEMDQLDAAYHAYEALRGNFPSPKVIDIKLYRIKERRAQRSR